MYWYQMPEVCELLLNDNNKKANFSIFKTTIIISGCKEACHLFMIAIFNLSPDHFRFVELNQMRYDNKVCF